MTFASWGFALIFLGLERFALTVFVDDVFWHPLGIIFAYIALVFSTLALVFLDLFSFYATFPNQVKRLIIISISLSAIYLAGLFSAVWMVETPGPGHEIIFPPYIDIIMLLTVLPLFVIPIIILLYYSYTMRIHSPPHARRAAWLAIAIFLVILSYVPEVLGPAELINILRAFYTIAAIIFYICFTRFIELRWAQKIHHLYLCLADKGTCLYDHSFMEEEPIDCSIVTGFISGISSLIQEITHARKRLKDINIEDIKILLEDGNKNIMGILLTEENYKILRIKMRKLLEIFEREFETELESFSGCIDPFKRTKKIVDRIFSYSEIL